VCFIVVVYDVNLYIIIIVTQRDGFRKDFHYHELNWVFVSLLMSTQKINVMNSKPKCMSLKQYSWYIFKTGG